MRSLLRSHIRSTKELVTSKLLNIFNYQLSVAGYFHLFFYHCQFLIIRIRQNGNKPLNLKSKRCCNCHIRINQIYKCESELPSSLMNESNQMFTIIFIFRVAS